MERTSRSLEQSREPLSKNALKGRVTGNAKAIAQAIDRLVDEGFARNTTPGRQTHLLESIKPYRQDSDPLLLDARAALYADDLEAPE